MSPGKIADELIAIRRRLTIETINLDGAGWETVGQKLRRHQKLMLNLLMEHEDVIVAALRAAENRMPRSAGG